jgi:hypothetical protein
MEITMATMGRLMKNFDTDHLFSASAPNGFGFTCVPSCAVADANRSNVHFVPGIDNGELVAALKL